MYGPRWWQIRKFWLFWLFNIDWFAMRFISCIILVFNLNKLRVICIGMVRKSMPLNDITNRFGVHAINFRTQHRTLWNSKVQLMIYWYRVFNNYTLHPTSEIRPEPIKCIASYTVKLHNRDSKISWSNVSNAAERFNISKMADEPASHADRMSFWTLIKALSVECLSLYADCSGSNMLLFIKCSLSLPDITFSMTFEINLILDDNFSRYRYINQFSSKVVEWEQF